MATEVVPLRVEQAVTLLTEPEWFGRRFGLALAEGCVVFPESLEPVVEALESGTDPSWFAHLVVDGDRDEVVGMGGYTGPPVDGEVEIGYGIAPARRGRGHATAAVRAWVDRADATLLPPVRAVRARTAPEENASTTVLRRCGFAFRGLEHDPVDGPLWSWRRERRQRPETPVPSSAAAEEGTGGRAGAARRS